MKQKNLQLFYLHELFFQFSVNMVSIVLTVFIYRLFDSVAAVFGFWLAWNAIYAILMIPILNLAIRWKIPKYIMALGMILYALAYWFFSKSTEQTIHFFYWGTLFYGIYIAFYWMMRHWFFAVNTDIKKMGRQNSLLAIIEIVVNFLGPILGGWLAFYSSYNAAFILGVAMVIASMVPILFFDFKKNVQPFSFKKVMAVLQKKEFKKLSPVYFWEGLEQVTVNRIWILAFTIFIGNIWQFGLLTGFATVVTTLATWWTGRFFDGKNRTFLLTKVTKVRVLTILLYVSVAIFPAPVYVWLVEFLNRLLFTSHSTILHAYFYGLCKKTNPLEFALIKEINVIFSRILFCSLFVIIFGFVEEWFLWVVLGLGAFSVLGFLGLKKGEYLLENKVL